MDGGFIEISNDRVNVLADHAEEAAEVNVDNARRQLDEANERLSHAETEQDSNAALGALRKAQALIDAAEYRGSTS